MKSLRLIFIIIFVLLLNLSEIKALEVGASFRLENLAFDKDREATQSSFSGTDLFWGVSVFGNHKLSENLSFEGGFYNDTILRNISYTLFNYNIAFLSLGVGPFFGFFNSPGTILKSGLSTSVRIELPGIIYFQLRADNSIGGRLIEDGDYIQERNDISAGFYVHNAICSLNINTKKFTQKKSGTEVIDSLNDYSFKTDIFQKNLPFKLHLSFSYQRLTKKYIDSSDPHTLNSIILGTAIDLDVTDYLTVLLNLESSIYTFGQDELLGISNPGPGGYLFRFYTGCIINFDKLKKPSF